MQFKTTGIEGLVQITPTVYQDDRGWFYEFYREDAFQKIGITNHFVQENHSFSKKGIVRGLHLQLPPFQQAKLVAVISGQILDVVVDLRKGSKTFGEVYSCLLGGNDHTMLMVPEGFAHGFAALEDSLFFYKCSNFYDKASESGIVWNDPQLKVDWPFAKPLLSEKDRELPTLDELLRKSVISRY